MLVPRAAPAAAAGRRRGAGQGRGRRRQPARRDAAPGPLSAARRARPTFPGSRSPARWWRSAPASTRWKLGDQVMALVVGGGYAEYCPAHESHCLPVPAGLTLIEAAAIPETFFTVWHNAVRARRAQARRDAAGPWRLVRHRHHRDPARQGVRRARDHHRRLAPRNARPAASSAPTSPSTTGPRISSPPTKAATGGKGADVILDMVGGDYIERNYEAAAVEGRVVQIAFQGEPEGDGRFPPHHAQAPHPHRLDAARPLGPRQGRDRARASRRTCCR